MLAGVVFRVGEALHFLPASVARKVMPMPEVARMPGGPAELRGVALVDGNMIPIVDLDPVGAPPSTLRDVRAPREPHRPTSKAMLVALVHGEPVGLVGLEIVATGHFATDDGVTARWGAAVTVPFDAGAAIARVRDGVWAV